jgi:hypothetical protein
MEKARNKISRWLLNDDRERLLAVALITTN